MTTLFLVTRVSLGPALFKTMTALGRRTLILECIAARRQTGLVRGWLGSGGDRINDLIESLRLIEQLVAMVVTVARWWSATICPSINRNLVRALVRDRSRCILSR